MSLEEKIETEIKTGMKAHDKVRVSTLRMVKNDIANFKLDRSKKKITDEEVIKIVQRQVKQHKDSIEQFEKGKRQDLVDKEKKELDILLGYMPKQLSDEELKKLIAETVKELGAATKKEMGAVMKTVMEKARGRADGKKVSEIVSHMLG